MTPSPFYFGLILLVAGTPLLAQAATSDRCPGEDGYLYTNYRTTNNPRSGGFVAWTATVADSTAIVIQPSAAVCGNAIISGSAKISGNALVRGDAQVGGSAVVTGNVVVEGTAKITGSSVVTGTGTLRSGTVHDSERALNEPAAAASGTSASAEVLSGKLQAYVATHAARFTPPDGSHYDGNTRIEQTISFSNGPCGVAIGKRRFAPVSNSSFHGTSKTRLDLGLAERAVTAFYSPSLSVAAIELPEYRQKAQREYSYAEYGSKVERTWVNHYHVPNSRTVESIEAPSAAHAENIRKILAELITACRQRR